MLETRLYGRDDAGALVTPIYVIDGVAGRRRIDPHLPFQQSSENALFAVRET